MARFCVFFLCVAFLGACTLPAAALDLSNGLLLHFDFENAADLGHDSSANGYNATLKSPQWLTAATGVGAGSGAIDFASEAVTGNTNSYGYMTVPSVPSSVVPTSAITVATWINLDRVFEVANPTSIERNTIFSTMAAPNGAHTTKGTIGITFDIRGTIKDDDTFYGQGYRWVLKGSDLPGERNAHTIVDFNYGNGEEANMPQRINEWIHVATTYDKATSSAALYIDGAKIFDYPVVEALDIDTDWTNCMIGRFTEGGREFRGLMDDLRVYTRALSSEEIAYMVTSRRRMGDADFDGEVNEDDAAVLAANWLKSGKTWASGDFTGDGIVNDADSVLLAANWTDASANASAPEPSALLMLAGVLFLPALAARKAKRA